MSVQFNRRVVRELSRLESVGLLDPKQVSLIAERYPTTDWDVASLVRCFTILGAISAGAGAVILASEAMNALRLLEAGLMLATGGLLASARWLTREKTCLARLRRWSSPLDSRCRVSRRRWPSTFRPGQRTGLRWWASRPSCWSRSRTR